MGKFGCFEKNTQKKKVIVMHREFLGSITFFGDKPQ